MPRPRPALWCESRLTPIVGKGEDLCPPDRWSEMNDITRCLTLFSPKPEFEIVHWTQTPCDTPLVPGAGAGGGQALTHDHQFDVPETTLEESEVSAAVAQFFALDDHHQRSFRIAMDRLNYSKSGIRRLEDQLIDLSIAAEALLLTAGDMSGQSYKVSLRGALLHSAVIQDRRAAFNSLGEMYHFRNQAVHGRTFAGLDEPHVAEVVMQAKSLIRSISLAFLARRGVPDWRETVLRQ